MYGFHDDTLDSLVLSILPPVGFQEFLETDKPKKPEIIPQDISPDVFLVKRLLRALRKRAGFRIPHVSGFIIIALATCSVFKGGTVHVKGKNTCTIAHMN